MASHHLLQHRCNVALDTLSVKRTLKSVSYLRNQIGRSLKDEVTYKVLHAEFLNFGTFIIPNFC